MVMMWWDDKLVEAVQKLNIRLISGTRYMYNIHIWLHVIRLGLRMVNGVMVYKKAWRQEEMLAGVTSLQKLTEILKDVMNNICAWLTHGGGRHV